MNLEAPIDIGGLQRRASDPAASAWVSANAGSGKTYVLAQRVVRLLLAGTDPGRILCLTFTKAAAAEMAKRVFDDLARWTRLSDAHLTDAIAAIEGRAPDRMELLSARRLFARALETPGGLKIQTIHAFCEQLLHRFPFEANVAGHFEVLDDRESSALLAEAQANVLTEAAERPDDRLGQALARATASVSDFEIFRAVSEFVGRRDRIRASIVSYGNLEALVEALRSALTLSPAESVAGLRRCVLGETLISTADLRDLARRLAGGSAQDRDQGARLSASLSGANDAGRVSAYFEFFFTLAGEPRKNLVTASTAAKLPGISVRLEEERRRVDGFRERLRAAECFETSAAILTLSDAVIAAYERAKARRGVLDFEDLVVKSANLLRREAAREWVHFKLDQGLDHILVDEAQDTSPRQWEVIEALAEEFFAGEGARRLDRTMFAVGDEKQSIYSFQGAAPAWFGRVRAKLRKRAQEAGLPWEDVGLHLSFRSSPDVLNAIDAVFESERAHRGLSSEGRPPPHLAMRRGVPGDVILWERFEALQNEPPDDWAAPLDRIGEAAPETRLAERIAATIAGWLARGEALPATGKPIRPGQILILTRKRGNTHAAVNRALKQASIPVAGADRLMLLDHIAVLDLLALAEVVLFPEDDLSLAALLRSPLFGVDETSLYQLAHGRKGTLWQALSDAAATDLEWNTAFRKLEAWRARADYLPPFEYFCRILGAEGGRRAFAGRLGVEAEEVLDEFLAEALAYERTGPPSLQGFLSWMKSAATEIRRDPAAPRDEVRVMTVHGAKGLEAEIVFLVDDGSAVNHSNHDPRLVELAEAGPIAWFRGAVTAPRPVVDRIEEIRARAAEEYRRLLYVAATRARDRLVVCGIKKRRPEPECWYELIHSALAPNCFRVESADGGPATLRWPNAPAPETLVTITSPDAPALTEPALPRWIGVPASSPTRISSLEPSRVRPGETAFRLHRVGEEKAASGFERGRILHRLLQALPDLPPEERPSAMDRYLAAAASHWAEDDRLQAREEILAVLGNPAFAEAFAPGSRAEVAIAGTVSGRSGLFSVRGQVDRLAVTAERVFIVDYKTNREPPTILGEVPGEYVRQLALYRLVLRQLYPGRSVAAALLWTSGPILMEITAETLDADITDLLGLTLTM